jgi:hypothetical protein
MKSRNAFSVRHGIVPESGTITEDAPIELRYFLLETFKQYYSQNPYGAASVFGKFLRDPAFANKYANQYDPTSWPRLYEALKQFEWWQIYDFIEYVYGSRTTFFQREFWFSLNEFFADQKIGYQMNRGGEIIYRGSEAFEATVELAEVSLVATGRKTAKDELHKAVKSLSERPVPDLTGAVQHAMAALECVANDVCGESGQTLGDVIKRNPDRFPEPLGTAVSKLYGFASNNGRHITEGREPDLKEVELIVGVAATVATYLCK